MTDIHGSCVRWLLALFLFCVVCPSVAADSASFQQGLVEAEKLRIADSKRFASMLDQLEHGKSDATPVQLDYLAYLQAYDLLVYKNEPQESIELAKKVFSRTPDHDLKFRTGSFLVNAYASSRHFSEGLRLLNQTLPMRRKVEDKDVRHAGIDGAGLFYNEMGQYALGLRYANEVLSDSPSNRNRCVAGMYRQDALYHLGKMPKDDADIQSAIRQCAVVPDSMAMNFLRLTLARKFALRNELDDAIRLLESHLAEAQAVGYRLLIADMNALLAELKLRKGQPVEAEIHANAAIEQAKQLDNPLSRVSAYKTLFLIAESREDLKAALKLYREYAEADRARSNDVKARELAFEIVRHETMQKSQQIELLNKKNEVLQLQQRVNEQRAQSSRLLILLLIVLTGSIGYWAFKIKRVQLSLRRMAETDSLTGIFNRHYFTQQSEKSLAQSAKAGEDVALIMFDLDHFKSINDRFGHDTGDWVLRRVAENCKTFCRRIDYLGRIGGEEFAILLSGCDLRAATRVAEDCRVRIASIDTQPSGHKFLVTASFGVTASSLSGYDLAKLLSHADKMLYRAKRGGRNRVATFDGEALQWAQLQPSSAADDASAPVLEIASAESFRRVNP